MRAPYLSVARETRLAIWAVGQFFFKRAAWCAASRVAAGDRQSLEPDLDHAAETVTRKGMGLVTAARSCG